MRRSIQRSAGLLLAAFWPCAALESTFEDLHYSTDEQMSNPRKLEEFRSNIDLNHVDWSNPFQFERLDIEFPSVMDLPIERSNTWLSSPSSVQRELRRTKSDSSSGSSSSSMKKTRSSSGMSKSVKSAAPTIPCYEQTFAPTKASKSSSSRSSSSSTKSVKSQAPTVECVAPVFSNLTIATMSSFDGPVVKADGSQTTDTTDLRPGDVWPNVAPVFDEDGNNIGTVAEICSVVTFDDIFFCEGVYMNFLNGPGNLNYQGTALNAGGIFEIIGGTGVYEGASGFILETFANNTAFRDITLE